MSNNIYTYNIGDPFQFINEGPSPGTDQLVFGPGILPSAVQFINSPTVFQGELHQDDVFVTLNGSIILSLVNELQFPRHGSAFQGAGVETIRFNNGTVYTLTDIVNKVIIQGTAQSDLLNSGLNSTGNLMLGLGGGDTLNGGSGNDTLDGGAGDDSLNGGSGKNTYRFIPQFGNDSVMDAAGQGTLDFSKLTTALNVDLRLGTATTVYNGRSAFTIDNTNISGFSNSLQTNGLATLSDGNVADVWAVSSIFPDGSMHDSIMFRKYDASGIPAGSPQQLAQDNWGGAVLPLANGFLRIYTTLDFNASHQVTGTHIHAQRYDNNGGKVGSELNVADITDTNTHQTDGAVLDNGDFIVVWDAADVNGQGVFGKRYTASGVAVGSSFLINTHTTGDQSNPVAARLPNHGFVVIWQSALQDGSAWGIYGQRFDGGNNKVGSEFKVNTTTLNDQINPEITVLNGGNFVVTWVSNNAAGIGVGINGQQYNSSGNIVGSEFHINTDPLGENSDVQIGRLSNGGFAVLWRTQLADNSASLFGQCYDQAGNKAGAEFLINHDTFGLTDAPQITALANGTFMVNWQMQGAVQGEIFTNQGAPVLHPDSVTVSPGSVKNVTGGSGFNNIVGDSANNLLAAGAGNGLLWGKEGNDTLQGGSGSNILIGGAGNDLLVSGAGPTRYQFYNDSGQDTISGTFGNGMLDFTPSSQTLSVNLAAGSGPKVTYGQGNTVQWTGALIKDVMAGSGNALLMGDSQNNVLTGGAGNDTFSGGTGNDALLGGAGTNIYQEKLGDGRDTITENVQGHGLQDRIDLGSGVQQSHVALFRTGNTLQIGYTDNNTDLIAVQNQFTAAGQLSELHLNNGMVLTAADLNSVIQAMAAYTQGHGLNFTSLADVKNSPALLNIITNTWHA